MFVPRFHSIVALFMCLLMPGIVRADNEPPLTLQSVLDDALANNPDLMAVRAQLEVERRRPGQERFLMPPMLEAQIWQWPLNRMNPAGATYMFVAEQSFPGRGKRELRERLAAADVGITAAALTLRARDVVNDLKRTYAELFVARREQEITRETIELLRQIAEGTQVRYAAGRTGQQDVVKAVVEISRIHDDEIAVRERIRLAEARLNVLRGRDPSGTVGALMEIDEQLTMRPVADLQQLAIEYQPELEMARAEIARAEAGVAVVRSERRPDFFVRGGYMLMPGEAGAFTAGVGISWPNAPWSRKRIDLAEEEARLDVTAARARYDAATNALRLMVQEAYIRVQSAAERAALLRTSLVPQTLQALDISRVGYQADRGEFLDIVDNQRMLAEARLGYYRALADLEQARADLERAVGAPSQIWAAAEHVATTSGRDETKVPASVRE